MNSNSEAIAQWNLAIQSNYGSPTIALSNGQGVEVWDVEGKRYLDFLGGIATNILGHAHPELVEAISQQAKTLNHVSNFYAHPQVLKLALKLQDLTGDSTARVFFCNSGAEANEAAFKLSRLTGRNRIVATSGAFHGRTMGALSLTGQESKKRAFKPLLKKITHVPFGDISAAKKAITKRTAMFILEPIQGENGVVVPPVGYLAALRDHTYKTGTLLVVDAVQTGMGRTSTWFGYESEGITPDVITLAKGLGGGLPLGAMIALGSAAQLFQAGSHGTTFGGNPIACAAANKVIEIIERDGLLAEVGRKGMMIKQALSELSQVQEVRGSGLLLGVVLKSKDAKVVAAALIQEGVLANAATGEVIRLAPALNVSDQQIAQFLEIFSKVVKNG